MLFPSPKLACRLALMGLVAACLLMSLVSVPTGAQSKRKRVRHSTKKVISDKEARKAAAKQAQLNRKLRGLHSHMRAVKGRIHEAKAKENRISEDLQTVETRLDRTRREIARVDARLETLDAKHQETERRLTETQNRLTERRRLLAQRIRYNYERGQATYAHLILQSATVHEALSRSYYVQRIVRSDADLIQSVRQDIVQIEADKRLLEKQTREQQQVEAEFQSRKQQYASDMDRKRDLLQGVQEQREAAEDELDGLAEEAEAMTSTIQALSEQLRMRREALRRAKEQAQASTGAGHRTTRQSRNAEPPSHDEIAPVWHGGFIRPVHGPITSGFGNRYHPILHRRKMHTGIDFGVGYGTPIHAAGGGVVIMATYTRGYGNCVVIDHGNGVTTLYGHCSALSVSAGENVSQGQVIGRVGSTGLSTGPHLHFEVRHNGVPVAPF